MSNLRQRLKKIEGAANPREVAVAEWAIRHYRAEQEFQRMLNEMKVRYGAGEPTPLLTQDEVLQKARELAVKYGGSEEAYQQSCTEYGKSSKCQELLMEIKRGYGLV